MIINNRIRLTLLFVSISMVFSGCSNFEGRTKRMAQVVAGVLLGTAAGYTIAKSQQKAISEGRGTAEMEYPELMTTIYGVGESSGDETSEKGCEYAGNSALREITEVSRERRSRWKDEHTRKYGRLELKLFVAPCQCKSEEFPGAPKGKLYNCEKKWRLDPVACKTGDC